MGAICGLIANKSKEDIYRIINNMIGVMTFRGADYIGSYKANSIGLGVAAHKTIGDITQPFSNESGEVIAVCDGEIYNYKEIRSQLLAKGHTLIQETDSEVIPHLYEEFGDSFPSLLNGIFTLALFDVRRKKILLARDHLGSRTVFYSTKGSSFIFASTIKAMLGTGIVKPKLSVQAIDLYFAGTCVPHPYTMMEEIKSVRPGYAVIWEDGSLREHEYWTLDHLVEDYTISENNFQDQIKALIIDAIKIRTMGDKPYGAILSGGVDSSLISSILTTFNPGTKLQTFSIGFKEEQFDETPLQKIMQSKYSFRNNKQFMGQEIAIGLLKKVVRNSDYPINNASAMGTYLCMAHVKSLGLERIFEGEAADEIFCGGGGVVGENLIELCEKIPKYFHQIICGPFAGSLQMDKTGQIAAIRRFCQRICMPALDRMLTWLPSFDNETRKRLLVGKYRQYVGKQDALEPGKFYLRRANFKEGINLYQYGACKTYLPNDLLFKNERMAAAHGVINRTPFIDYRLVELAFKIPAKYKLTGYTVHNAEKKLIYRKAIQGMLPEKILWRKKTQGFVQPINMWIRDGLKEFVLETILGKQAIGRDIVNPAFIKQLVEEHMSGKEDRSRLLWGILTLELWIREFID